MFSLVGVGGVVWAQDETVADGTAVSVEEVIAQEEVGIEDLEVGDPGLLPTSPFYFIKEIGRGFQRALTFDNVAKAELELKIASEKAAEAKKVVDQSPSDEQGISRALSNYQRGQERLRARIEGLRDTSNNPNVDRLLDSITDRQIVHEKLLQNLHERHESHRDTIERIRSHAHDVLGEVAERDGGDQFGERLHNAFERARGSSFKHIRSVEIVDRLREREDFPEDAKERLINLRSNLSGRMQENIERFVEQDGEGNGLERILDRIPGDAVRRSNFVDELRTRASDRASRALDAAHDVLDRKVERRREDTTRPRPNNILDRVDRIQDERQDVFEGVRDQVEALPLVPGGASVQDRVEDRREDRVEKREDAQLRRDAADRNTTDGALRTNE
jgi:hypothetical protein